MAPIPGGTTPTTAPTNPDVDLVLTVGDEVTAQLDDRFQSYNVEMVEVTGGYLLASLRGGRGQGVPRADRSELGRLRNLARPSGGVHPGERHLGQLDLLRRRGTTGGTPPAGYEGVPAEQWRGRG
ncbi:MAG: hypothetical protein H6519_05810 [Microthrixaceae bacterium]|nr:hypothetical protein [Microthrixaceae bacterium]